MPDSANLKPTKIAASLAALIAPFAILWFIQGDKLTETISSFPLMALAGAMGVHILWLCFRAEAWRLSVSAIDRQIPRAEAHAASAAGYATGCIQSASGLPVRAGTLRKISAEAPTISRSLVAEAPVIALEAILIGTIFLIAVSISPLVPAWGALIAVAGAGLALGGMYWAVRTQGHRPAVAGLNILRCSKRRKPLIGIVLIMCTLGLTRALFILMGAGLPHDPASIAFLFATMGLLGSLPLGPAAGPGAMLAVFGSVNAVAAAGAGVAMFTSMALGVVLYSLVTGAVFVTKRARDRSVTPDAI